MGRGSPEVSGSFGSPLAKIAVIVVVGLGVSRLAVLLAAGDGAAALVTLGWLLILGMLGYLFFWRPAMTVDDDGVRLRNPLRDITVPWGALVAVDTRFALTLVTDGGKYTSWAAAAPGRPLGTFSPWGEKAAKTMTMPPSVDGPRPEAMPASRRLDGDAGAAAFLVESAWARWRARQADPAGMKADTAASSPQDTRDDVLVTYRLVPLAGLLAGVAVLVGSWLGG